MEIVSGYPALIEVTVEELETGLESGLFTSVDLVNVLYRSLKSYILPNRMCRHTLRES